jgi:glycosyltransferase involved in cell wall biosynthesis
MNATLIIEHRFRRDRDGKVYASSNSVNTLLWERYLEVFDQLTVLARIKDVEEPVSENYLVSHDKVSFKAIPYYVGPKQFAKQYFKINRVIETQVKKDHAYICRLPSILGAILLRKLKRKKIPYVVELVGDPWEVFAPGSLKNSLAFIHRYRSYLSLKKNVKNASGVIYVTEKMLQQRYPASNRAVAVHASNVLLKKEVIALSFKKYSNKIENLKMLSIGSLEQLYKSPDIVLEALGLLKKQGMNFELTWLGDGIHKKEMQNLAKVLGITEYVNFKGNVVSSEVLEELKTADLYIHVSRTEGLPRAIIESMAQGLPSIGTRVGGIPELLAKECLIEKNDVSALVEKILYCYHHPEFMEKMGRINLNKAKEYEYSILAERRNSVYDHLKNLIG